MARKGSQTEDVAVKPPSDAYTGLLALSLIAMIASCVILYLDYAQYGNTKAQAPNVPPVTKPAAAGTTSVTPPNLLAAIASEPLPAVPTIVPVSFELPIDSGSCPADGPQLPAPG